MESELQARVNIPVVLVNREGLYVIIAVLGVSILGCAGVLTYSFSNYAKLKRNAEEVRSYIASRVKAVDQVSGGKEVTAADVTGGVPVNDRPATVKAMILQEADSDHAMAAALATTGSASEYHAVNSTTVTVAGHGKSATNVEVMDSQEKGVQAGASSSITAASTYGTYTAGTANRG